MGTSRRDIYMEVWIKASMGKTFGKGEGGWIQARIWRKGDGKVGDEYMSDMANNIYPLYCMKHLYHSTVSIWCIDRALS